MFLSRTFCFGCHLMQTYRRQLQRIFHQTEIREGSAELEQLRIVVAVVAELAGHDAVARLEAAVPALADDALARELAIEVALRSGEVNARWLLVRDADGRHALQAVAVGSSCADAYERLPGLSMEK
jgi:hypothetical protein